MLADGGTARVRPIRPDDGPALRDFHARQSPESIYFRYFSPAPAHRQGGRAPHPRRLRRPHGLRRPARRRADRRGPLRPLAHPLRGRGGVLRRRPPHRPGLATVLLEYLAAAARRAGSAGFTATVLPTNHRMVGVFTRPGSRRQRLRGRGHRGAPRPPADPGGRGGHRGAGAQRRGRGRPAAAGPRSVAVIGAGRDRTGVGHAVLRNLLLHEFAGPVYPVNPEPTTSPACGPTPPSTPSTGRSTWRSWWCRPPRWPTWSRSAAARASGRRRDLRRVRRVRPEGRPLGRSLRMPAGSASGCSAPTAWA